MNARTNVQPFGKRIWANRYLLIMVLPTVLYFIIFRYMPIAGLVIAFQNYIPKVNKTFFENIANCKWVGLDHFIRFFTSNNGLSILRNTIVISLYKLIFSFPAPIILALMLNELKSKMSRRIIQSVTFLPYFISWVILGGILKMIFSPDVGILKPILASFGMQNVNVFGDSGQFTMLLIFSDIWQSAGYGSIIYLAAISGINLELYEAANMDGAGRIRCLWHVTLPGIAPTIATMFIMRTGKILMAGFDQVFNLYTPAVYRTADILDTYIYRAGLLGMEYSYTTAMGFFQALVGLILVLVTNAVTKSIGQRGIW